MNTQIELSNRDKTRIEKTSKAVKQEKRRLRQPLDTFDRIQFHILEGKPLTRKSDRDLLSKSQQIYPLLCAGKTAKYILKFVKKQGWGGEATAYRLIRQTKKIFYFQDENRDLGTRSIYVEMAKKAYNYATKKGDPRAMVSAAKLAAQLDGALNETENYTLIFQNLVLPPIQFSDNPEAVEVPEIEVEFNEE